MKRTAVIVATIVTLVLIACGQGTSPKEGDLCNHAGATANHGTLRCERNNGTTGPLVWRKA